jgi:hypothetical protein
VIRPDLYEPEIDAVYAALLAHWEGRWAAPRIHGRRKRQVLAMLAEEQPCLRPLRAQRFRYLSKRPARSMTPGSWLLEEQAAAPTASKPTPSSGLTQAGADIRPIGDYQAFFEQHAECAASPALPSTERNHDEHVND